MATAVLSYNFTLASSSFTESKKYCPFAWNACFSIYHQAPAVYSKYVHYSHFEKLNPLVSAHLALSTILSHDIEIYFAGKMNLNKK